MCKTFTLTVKTNTVFFWASKEGGPPTIEQKSGSDFYRLKTPPAPSVHFGPIRQEWLYHIAPKITVTLKPYHVDHVGTQSAGKQTLLGNRLILVQKSLNIDLFLCS